MRAKWNSSAHLSQQMYPPRPWKNFSTWLLLMDQEEWKRNQYEMEKTGSKHIWKRSSAKPNLLFLEQQKLQVLQLNWKAEYKMQCFLNKKLLSATAHSSVSGTIITKNKIQTKIPDIWSAWRWWVVSKTPQSRCFQALLHWKKNYRRTNHKGGATLTLLFFECHQVNTISSQQLCH